MQALLFTDKEVETRSGVLLELALELRHELLTE